MTKEEEKIEEKIYNIRWRGIIYGNQRVVAKNISEAFKNAQESMDITTDDTEPAWEIAEVIDRDEKAEELKEMSKMVKIEKEDKDTDIVDQKVEKFMDEYHEHGLGCGLKIAEIASFMHPNALLVVPLYRSCIVVEQGEEDAKKGSCTVHSYADPHWLGGEIDAKTLKLDDFHSIFKIHGDRQGAYFVSSKHKVGESLFERI